MIKIKFFDVSLGNATLIETETMNILFDIGYDNTKEHPLFSFDGDLDYLIITHPHEDHITGLNMIDYKEPKVLCRNKEIPLNLIQDRIDEAINDEARYVYNKYLELNMRYTEPVANDKSPTNPEINGNVEIYHYYPEDNSTDLNYYSIATFLKYEGYRILLMGDNTHKNIKELLENRDFCKKAKNIDILLAPHHGRDSSYDEEFLNLLNPQLTIISDERGKDDVSASNKYSKKSRGHDVHENGKIKERYCLTTRNDGIIEVIIKNNQMSVYCEK